MRSLGQNPTEGTLDETINEVDSDKNGTLGISEFVAMMEKRTKDIDPEDEMIEYFRVFDKDGNGYISREELKQTLIMLGRSMIYFMSASNSQVLSTHLILPRRETIRG